jgi:aspartyl protease family protein
MPIGSQRTMVGTANGPTWVTRGRADSLEIGSIRREAISVNINEQDDLNLLGMNFLQSLRGWGVEGNYLVLRT